MPAPLSPLAADAGSACVRDIKVKEGRAASGMTSWGRDDLSSFSIGKSSSKPQTDSGGKQVVGRNEAKSRLMGLLGGGQAQAEKTNSIQQSVLSLHRQHSGLEGGDAHQGILPAPRNRRRATYSACQKRGFLQLISQYARGLCGCGTARSVSLL